MNSTLPTDAQLRAWRDAIYAPTKPDQIQSDESWNQIKHNWRREEAWLREQYESLKAT